MKRPAAATIAVFDSGVGGLTVLSALQDRLPHARYVYAFDNAHFPYGTRSDDDVVRLTAAAVESLRVAHHADVVVIACNTASTIALAKVREGSSIPVVGTVPAIKPAATLSKSKVIGLLATPATIVRPYTDDLVSQFAQGCLVLRRGSARLVTLAEAKLRGEPVPLAEVAEEVAPLFAVGPQGEGERLDTIVLGCTHFPLLADEIQSAAPWPVRLIDSSAAIAARTVAVLEELGLDTGVPGGAAAPEPLAVATAPRDAESLRTALARFGIVSVGPL